MRNSRRIRRLLIPLVRYRLRPVLLVVMVGVVLGLTVCGAAALRESTLNAQGRAAGADQADFEFALQAGSGDARELLAETPKLQRVEDGDATVLTSDAAAPALVRTMSAPAGPVGALVEGHRATQPGQAAVSLALQHQLAVRVGDTVNVTADDVTVPVEIVGVTVNEANVDDATIVTVVDELSASDTTVWLSHTDPYANPGLRSALDDRSITYRSVSTLSEDARRSVPPAVAGLAYAPLLAALLLGLVAVGVLLSLSSVAREDTRLLTQAGVPPRQAWRLIGGVASGSLIGGMILGGTLATATVWVARVSIAARLDQYWTTTAVPWLPATLLVLAVIVLAVVARPAALAASSVGDWIARPSRGRPRSRRRAVAGVLAGCGVAVIAAAAAARLQSPPNSIAGWAPAGGLMVVASLPILIGDTFTRRLPPATSTIAHRLVASVSLVAVVASLIAATAAVSAARTTHNANAAEGQTSAPQPPGSFLIYEVPDEAAGKIAGRFRDLGGQDVQQYELPDETQRRIRVTGTDLVDCMEKAQVANPDAVSPDCFPQDTMSPVNTVMLSIDGKTGSRADPGLIEDGEVGLLEYTGTTGDAKSIAITDAAPDPLLGGNMPGMVVDPSGPVAQKFGLQTGGTRLVALLDFEQLDEHDQSLMRGTVARIAPGAQIADADQSNSYDQDRAIANVKAVAGTILALLVILAGGAAVLSGHRVTRRILVDIGSNNTQRLRLFVTWVATPALTLAIAIPVTVLTTSLGGINRSGDWGFAWLMPPTFSLAACLLLAGVAMRVPARVGE